MMLGGGFGGQRYYYGGNYPYMGNSMYTQCKYAITAEDQMGVLLSRLRHPLASER